MRMEIESGELVFDDKRLMSQVKRNLRDAMLSCMRVMRMAAMKRGPTPYFRDRDGYRIKVRLRDLGTVGTLQSGGSGKNGAGKFFEGGAKAGRVHLTEKLRNWLTAHGYKVNPKSTGANFRPKVAKPWVIPAAESVRDRAEAAFMETLTKATDFRK